MPWLEDHQSAETTKLLLIGDSGGGKTGALASLARAGFILRGIDVDSGFDILVNILKDKKDPNYKADAIKNCSYITITDKMKNVGNKLVPAKATVWSRMVSLLSGEVKDPLAQDDPVRAWGPLVTWTPQHVLAIDSLTFVSMAAMNHILAMNARLGQTPWQEDWFSAQQLVEGLLAMLYDEGVKANVIVTSHITFIGKENSPETRGYPNTLGKALPPKVGRYFNTILQAQTSGFGSNQRRKILTRTSSVVELKNTAPSSVQPDYPIETGLADYFRDVRTGK